MVGAYKLPVSRDNTQKSINNVDANEPTNEQTNERSAFISI